jgi:hypothetical protein
LGSADDRLHSRIHGLERHRPVQSQLLARLAWNLKTLFGLAAVDLPAYHYTLAPTELVVDLTRMKKAVQAIPSERWRPADLPAALAYLPAATPLALYGRGPNWLYAALTIHAWPAPCYQFDARLGWVEPPILQPTPLPPVGPLAFTHHHRQDYDWLEAQIVDSYLDESVSELWPSSATASWRSFFASFGRTWVVVACQREEKGENNAKPRVWGRLAGRGRPPVCCRRCETRKKWCGSLTPQHGAARSPTPLTLLPYTLGWKANAARLVHAALAGCRRENQ